ncbi:hypothetical protein [Cupriavidus sp. D384]|uniref:hypothetical protein n=1 Tax=Cupriavidus sp. D384 TaxID=1538095 RepID=UPI000834EE35|nr:hypothetical protein [Cupriavidus sp. D384]
MPVARTVAAAWLLMLVPALAVAQASAPAAGPADPMNAAAPVPALPDIAPMAGYVPYQSPKVSPWRQSNAEVTPGVKAAADPHAGHHMPQGAAAPAAAPASAPATGHDGHAGHHAH